jgi:DNA helicase-2/ATP-dependent DNA helicase PcrA
MNKHPEKIFPPLEDVLGYFKYKMRDKELAFTKLQYERRLEMGVELLSEYYNENIDKWAKEVQLEKFLLGNLGAIPIKGKIDKIELLADNYCRVIDYKTGKPDSPHTKENLAPPNDKNEMRGGDYWRQMVFYKLLVEAQPFNKLQVGEGIFEYIEKGKNGAYNHKVIIVPADEQIVKSQMEHTFKKSKASSLMKAAAAKTAIGAILSKAIK